jgi:hypothetical protein
MAAKTLIIYELQRSGEERTIVKTPKKNFFGKIIGENEIEEITSYQYVFFNIQYPDNNEEEIVYYKCQGHIIINNETRYAKYSNWPEQFLQLPWQYDNLYARGGNLTERRKTLQKIINNLGNKGYSTPVNQIALFMDSKIDKLIMQKA